MTEFPSPVFSGSFFVPNRLIAAIVPEGRQPTGSRLLLA